MPVTPWLRALSNAVPGLLVLGSLLVSAVVGGIYRGIGLPMPIGVDGLGWVFFQLSLWSWFWSYCRRHRMAWPLDMGAFLAVGWFVIVPYYLFRAEGRRAWGLIAIFAAALVAAWAVTLAVVVWLKLLLGHA